MQNCCWKLCKFHIIKDEILVSQVEGKTIFFVAPETVWWFDLTDPHPLYFTTDLRHWDLGVFRLIGNTGPHKFRGSHFEKGISLYFWFWTFTYYHCPLLLYNIMPSNNVKVEQHIHQHMSISYLLNFYAGLWGRITKCSGYNKTLFCNKHVDVRRVIFCKNNHRRHP